MRRINIPRCKDTLTLASPWTITLKNLHHNGGFFEALGHPCKNWRYPLGADRIPNPHYPQARGTDVPNPEGMLYTFPAGETLTITRIYLRNIPKSEDFDSLTFRTRINGKSVRFFASLDDVNQMEVIG